MILIDGRAVAKKVKEEVFEDVIKFKEKYGKAPVLAVVSVGDDPASKIYLKHKEKASGEVGIQFLRFELDKKNSQEELDALITRLNSDQDVNGILVQLPIPPQFSIESVLSKMNPLKDSDGFHPENLGLLMSGRPRVKPCTPFGIMRMLEHYKIPVSGKKTVVVGRSNIVGKPMALLLLAGDASVTMCHSKTVDLKSYTTEADIVVVAAGKPELLDVSYFNPDCVVIDVGMHHLQGKLVGDVEFKSVVDKVGALSPVPGGVGPMTVAMLLRNTVDLANYQERHRIV